MVQERVRVDGDGDWELLTLFVGGTILGLLGRKAVGCEMFVYHTHFHAGSECPLY